MSEAVNSMGNSLESSNFGIARKPLPAESHLARLCSREVAGLALSDLIELIIVWSRTHACKTFGVN